MAVRVTPAQFREKHARRTKAALEDMKLGVNRVTEAPGVKAAASADKMRARLLESIDNGKWARRVAGVSLAEWKEKMINKGIPRVSAGIDGAAQKVEEFAAELIQHENALLTTMESMPSTTLDDSINRATAWIRGMSAFERGG